MRWVTLLAVVVLASGCLGTTTPPSGPQVVPGTTTLQLQLTKTIGDLSQPVFAAFPADGRTYIVEQGGIIRTWDGTALSNFLDVSSSISTGGERGLLGLAFEPNSKAQRFVIYYTATNGDIQIDRYQVQFGIPLLVAHLLTIPHHEYSNHNGGMVSYGPDGMLYIGVGDGGGGGDPDRNGQNTNALLAKILRIDPSQSSGGKAYSVPIDNPFVRGGGAPEVWAYGLRNPWRFSFDRQTGGLWIGDVGQNQWEEIDMQGPDDAGGRNYGWNIYEGSHSYDGTATGVTMPVAEYDHSGSRCSVTGGYVYRGTQVAGLVGTYLYGDYCSGEIWGLTRAANGWTNTLLLESHLLISSFAEDEDGELYVVDHGGRLLKIALGNKQLEPSGTSIGGLGER